MRRIRVMLVDDSAAVRRLLADALAIDSDLQVVAAAENGKVALEKIPTTEPDVIVLDIEMPVMGGLETLVEVRRTYPRLPVIVFSSDTKPGAEATLDALWLGASDYVTKSKAQSPSAAVRDIHAELVPRIKALCVSLLHESPPPRTGRATVAARGRERERAPAIPLVRPAVQIVAIGASTGGPNALTTLIGALPADFPVPVVVVQHMPPLFTRFLADRLSAKSALAVTEAREGEALRPGRVWIAPGDHHLTLRRNGSEVRLALDQSPPINSCRPSVDTLFRSVADAYGACALGVILTGMGQDGLRGCERVAWARGQVLAQDEGSSVVWGMPGSVARSGLADRVLPIDELAGELMRRVQGARARRPKAA